MVPRRDELEAELISALQETDTYRLLDSIETVTVQACLSRWGLEYSDSNPPPTTIEEWIAWAVRHSSHS